MDVTFEKVEEGKGDYVHVESTKEFDKTDEKQFEAKEGGEEAEGDDTEEQEPFLISDRSSMYRGVRTSRMLRMMP